MKLFVWHRVTATDNYHEQGGVLIIAEDLAMARSLWDGEQAKRQSGRFDKIVPFFADEPDEVFELAGDYEPKVFVHPDAGCC